MLAGCIALIVICAAAYVMIVSERVIARTYDTPVSSFKAPDDADSIATGRRLATIYGCNDCHGPDLGGATKFDLPNIIRISAPNLTQAAHEYSDGELERVIRHGVRRDGSSTWVMPAQMFSHLSDADLGAIIAYVRSMPLREGSNDEVTIRALGRVGLVTRKFLPVAEQVATAPPSRVAATDDPLAPGRYLVMTACTECHGPDLHGSDIAHAPNLIVAGAYSDEDFEQLLRTGTGSGNRELGLMGEVARARFSALSLAEVQAIRAYLVEFVRQGGGTLP